MPRPLPPALSELETRLGLDMGSLEGVDKTRAETALVDATTLVLAEVPAPRAAAWETDAPRAVELVVLTAARRGYENPRGIAQETLGQHTVGLTESTGVYLTAREVAQVRRAHTGRTGGYTGTIRTPSAYDADETAVDTVYTPMSDGSAAVPFLSLADLGEAV